MKKKVLVVEDSILMQRVISDVINASEEYEVIGCARDVIEGWGKFNKLKPDIVTLDFELPHENGLVLLKKIMEAKPVPVLMVSAHTKAGAELTMRALSMGAVDFFTKPSGPISIDLYNYRDVLLEKLQLVADSQVEQPPLVEQTPPAVKGFKELYVGIAASTGGVRALNYIIPSFPAKCGIRIIIVQHMPKFFTASLALHLNERSSMVVKEAQDNDLILDGQVLIAQGGFHILVDPSGEKVVLSDDPPLHGVKPSADILFSSMAKAYRERAIGVVLTGMGRDGTAGIVDIKRMNGTTIVQDPNEAVISGMPQSAISTNMIDHILPLNKIPDMIFDFVQSQT